MSIRTAPPIAAALALAATLSAPLASAAHAQEVLSAPWAYATPGACYAHVRRAPRYAPAPPDPAAPGG